MPNADREHAELEKEFFGPRVYLGPKDYGQL
jgi:hypothetical protein